MNWRKACKVKAFEVPNEQGREGRTDHCHHKDITRSAMQHGAGIAAAPGPQCDGADGRGGDGAAYVKGDQWCQLHGAALSQVLACTVLLARDGRERLAMNGRCRGVKCRWIA